MPAHTHTHTHTHRGCGEVFCGRRRGCHLSTNCPLLLALAEGEDQLRGSVCPGGGDRASGQPAGQGWGCSPPLPHGAGTPPPHRHLHGGPCGLAVITVQSKCVCLCVSGDVHTCAEQASRYSTTWHTAFAARRALTFQGFSVMLSTLLCPELG